MKCNNKYISIFSNALIQTTIIFAFLTTFFFSYVSKVENEEFKSQLEFVVDSIYKRYSNEIRDLLNNTNNTYTTTNNERYTKTLIYGLIDVQEEDIKKSSIKEEESIDSSNKQIIKNSTFYVGVMASIVFVVLLFLFILMRKMFDCSIPIKSYIKEGLILLIFVFIVEFVFLNVIVKNYVSANPNYIKNKITESIIKYINERKK